MIPINASEYTLRKTAVTPYVEAAKKMGIPIVYGTIGNANCSTFPGIKPFQPLLENISDAAKDPEKWGYLDSHGLGELRYLIGKIFLGHTDVNTFIRAGVSDVSDMLFRVIFSQNEYAPRENKDAISIPDYTYILYRFLSAINHVNVTPVELDNKAAINLESFERSITCKTRMGVIVTIGNPIGTAVSEEHFKQIIEIINRKEREFNKPIYLLVDVIYELLRRKGTCLDPIDLARKYGRTGPTIVVDSISKVKMVAPGARFGWGAVEWPKGEFSAYKTEFLRRLEQEQEKITTDMSTFQLPFLGINPSIMQYGLLETLRKIDTKETEFAEYQEFTKAHVNLVHKRVESLLAGLIERFYSKGNRQIIFPDFSYSSPGDKSGGVDIDRIANSMYLSFGVDGNISSLPLGEQIAEFGLRNGLVLATTPMGAFVSPEKAREANRFVRDVALHDEGQQILFFKALDDFLRVK